MASCHGRRRHMKSCGVTDWRSPRTASVPHACIRCPSLPSKLATYLHNLTQRYLLIPARCWPQAACNNRVYWPDAERVVVGIQSCSCSFTTWKRTSRTRQHMSSGQPLAHLFLIYVFERGSSSCRGVGATTSESPPPCYGQLAAPQSSR
eukprot:6129167-Pleurochrysis_carterae.AAC.3